MKAAIEKHLHYTDMFQKRDIISKLVSVFSNSIYNPNNLVDLVRVDPVTGRTVSGRAYAKKLLIPKLMFIQTRLINN